VELFTRQTFCQPARLAVGLIDRVVAVGLFGKEKRKALSGNRERFRRLGRTEKTIECGL
jgi:hypothetical protein